MSPVTAIRLIFFLDGLIIAKWLPHIPDIQADLGLDVGQLGLALAALPLGIMSSLPLIGAFVIARLSERAAIRVTFLWLAVSSVLPGLAWDLPSFAVALFLYGSGIAGVEVAMNATADAVEGRVGRRIMSSCHGLWSVGNLAGAALGSAALALHLDAMVTLTVAAPILMGVAYLSTGQLSSKPISSTPGPALALPDLPLLLLCLLPFCACLLEGAMADWAAVYLRSEHGAQGALTGAGFGIFAAIMAATRLAGDRIVDRVGPVLVARCCGVSGVLGLLVRPASLGCPDRLCVDGSCGFAHFPDFGDSGGPAAGPISCHEYRFFVADLLFRLCHRPARRRLCCRADRPAQRSGLPHSLRHWSPGPRAQAEASSGGQRHLSCE